MGWTVLYIAFTVVALWLLGEVLLQYKARLRWRVLAFAGFSTVVLGVVVLSSVVVIALGAAAFAVGQTFVTLSYRRGFSTGWALGGMPGSSRRRREGNEPLEGEDVDPVLEVSGVEQHDAYGPQEDEGYQPAPEYEPSAYEPPTYEPPTYAPQPMPDETGEYGIYDRGDQSVFEPSGYGNAGAAAGAGYGHGQVYGEQEQHQYASYADPYAGYDAGQGGEYAATASYDAYGGYDAGGGYGGYDAYGGAWVPQQREADQQAYGYGDQSYGYGYPYAEAGYGGGQEAYGYGSGNGYGYGYGQEAAAPQGYDGAGGQYSYDEQRGY